MLSHEIVERLAPIFGNREGDLFIFPEWMQPTTLLIAALAIRCEQIYDKIDTLAKVDQTDFAKVSSDIRRLIGNVEKSSWPSKPRQFFESYEMTLKAFRDLKDIDVENDYLTGFLSDFEAFAEKYDDYLTTSSVANAWSLLRLAQSVQIQLHSIFAALHGLYVHLEAQDYLHENAPDCSALSLSLPGSDDYRILVSRLSAIARLYSEICRLLGVSEHDVPLQVIKIESGSLWVKVLGESRVIGLMIRFMEQGAAFIHRTYTQEGKIAVVPQKVDAVDRLIGLRKALLENGIDTSVMDEEISAAAIAISKGLNHVLQGQPSIRINGNTRPISDADPERYRIEARATPMLEHQAEDECGSDDLPS